MYVWILLACVTAAAGLGLLSLLVGGVARIDSRIAAMTAQPRHYTVTMLIGDVTHKETVSAYDLMEAMMAASLRMTATVGIADVKVIDVAPATVSETRLYEQTQTPKARDVR